MKTIDKEAQALERKKHKAHKLLRNHDPVIDQDNYKTSLMLALNHYNREHDNKEKKSWAVGVVKGVKFNSELPDYEFKMLGTLCRIVGNGYELSERHQIFMDNEVKRLSVPAKLKAATKDLNATLRSSIQDKMDEKVSEFLGEFAGLVDDYTVTGTIPRVDKLVAQFGIRGPMIKKVTERVTNIMEELEEAIAGTDKQLVEGYSQFKKTELKKLLGIYTSLIEALGQAKVTTVRKARVMKAKPPTVIAKNVKFQAENKDLKLKSVLPALCVGADTVYVFNTKYRRLHCYEAIKGQTLTWKGTSFQNWDVTRSTCKTLRKPEMLQALDGKRKYATLFRETKATEKPCNGRLSADYIILAAFK